MEFGWFKTINWNFLKCLQYRNVGENAISIKNFNINYNVHTISRRILCISFCHVLIYVVNLSIFICERVFVNPCDQDTNILF